MSAGVGTRFCSPAATADVHGGYAPDVLHQDISKTLVVTAAAGSAGGRASGAKIAHHGRFVSRLYTARPG